MELTVSRHPELVTHVFSVCTPYTPAQKQYSSLEDLVKGPLPQFGYQIHLASGEVEKIVNSEETIRQFLKGIYGASGPNREAIFDPVKGVIAEHLPKLGESRILNGKALDYYVQEYSRNGIHGPLNWYRTRKANWEDEVALLGDRNIISIPTLFIQATYDSVLKPEMAKAMERFLPNLTRGEVKATHWVLAQKPDETNAILKNWLESQILGTPPKSSL
jgi:pimeloyl-ACP methyl ester carboxylesterase